VIIIYDQKLNIKLKFLGFNINIFSKNVSYENKSDKFSKNKNDNISISNLIKKGGVIGTIKYIHGALKLLPCTTRKILKRATIKTLTLNYSVAGQNPFETSIKYGQSSALIFTVLGIIDSINPPQHLEVNIFPDYTANQSSFKFNLHICAKSFFIMYSMFFFTAKYIKYLKNR
jgi:hypothetical protein